MKPRHLTSILAGSLVLLAAWLVQRDYPAGFNAPVAHGAAAEDIPVTELPEKYKDTLRKGLEYLAKQQHAEGHWTGDDGQHPIAMTGLVGLALVMEKNNARVSGLARQTKHATQIRKAADWLIAQSQADRDGLLFSGHASETTRYMEGHGLATLFLAGAFAEERDPVRQKKLAEVVARAVKYIVKARSSRGGWYHTSKVEGHDFDDILVTVIQLQALQAAENAGSPVPRESILDAEQYLRTMLCKTEKEAKGGLDHRRLMQMAGVLAACCNSSGEIKGAEGKAWLKLCQQNIPLGRGLQFGRDELTHYYYAQALFSLTDKTIWTGYRTAMFDHLQSTQKPDGSWPAGNGLSVGPVYATALWCTLLQLDMQSHPSARMLALEVL